MITDDGYDNNDNDNDNDSNSSSYSSSNQIHFNYLHPELVHLQTKEKMELDIYIPHLNLAFEYQGKDQISILLRGIQNWLLLMNELILGEHHFHSHPVFVDQDSYKKNDQQKREACQQRQNLSIQLNLSIDLSFFEMESISESIERFLSLLMIVIYILVFRNHVDRGSLLVEL